MVFKCGERHGLLILAHYGEQNTPVEKALEHPLEIDVRLAHRIVAPEFDILPSELTDSSSPQRVIQVEHQELSGIAPDCLNGPLYIPSCFLKHFVAERYLCRIPERRIERGPRLFP